ncbi:hypothetical protein Taro_050032 [Colocasia esculenta]|uniref:Lipoxygenase domain-containing protein n=1 Tax=Colocasia esculenta TaxID=4460 RepID=A0A843XCP5_COLES|nr:hypothetical protein [Colocasia esculenta]
MARARWRRLQPSKAYPFNSQMLGLCLHEDQIAGSPSTFLQTWRNSLKTGDHIDRELKEGERIYGYMVYNDLRDPDKGAQYERPVLGGSKQYPYPHRRRTSRPPRKTDPNLESRMFLANIRFDIYVPRGEKFGHLNMSDFLGHAIKSVNQFIFLALRAVVDKMPMEFDTFKDVLDFYEGGALR